MYTEREALERVPSFTEQLRRAGATTRVAEHCDDDPGAPVMCDSCGREVREPLRARCRECPPPPLPSVAQRILADLRARREQRGDTR